MVVFKVKCVMKYAGVGFIESQSYINRCKMRVNSIKPDVQVRIFDIIYFGQ